MRLTSKQKLFMIGLIVIVFMGGIIYSLIPKPRYYNTIDEAIHQDKVFRNAEYLGQIESKGVCNVFYNKTGEGVSPQFLFYQDQKWKLLKPLNISKRREIITGYIFDYSYYNGKHIISILGSSSSSGTEKSQNEVIDSVFSEFEVFHYQNEAMSSYYWMIVFDALPDNYSVTFGGKTIALN